ncbi:MAG: hypothetical protein ACI30A_04645 [Paludibacteraceae bacterium]
MAKQVTNLSDIQDYFQGVMNRAEHHADNVNAIILALIGCVIWKSKGNFWVREYAGAPANMLWMDVDNTTYCFRYNHVENVVELRKDSVKGNVIKTFDNQTSLADLKNCFEKL